MLVYVYYGGLPVRELLFQHSSVELYTKQSKEVMACLGDGNFDARGPAFSFDKLRIRRGKHGGLKLYFYPRTHRGLEGNVFDFGDAD
jgi:hypothetical protein